MRMQKSISVLIILAFFVQLMSSAENVTPDTVHKSDGDWHILYQSEYHIELREPFFPLVYSKAQTATGNFSKPNGWSSPLGDDLFFTNEKFYFFEELTAIPPMVPATPAIKPTASVAGAPTPDTAPANKAALEKREPTATPVAPAALPPKRAPLPIFANVLCFLRLNILILLQKIK